MKNEKLSYYARNKDRLRPYLYKKNKERIEADREGYNEYMREYRKKNREKLVKYQGEYRKKNIKKIKEYNKKYYKQSHKRQSVDKHLANRA